MTGSAARDQSLLEARGEAGYRRAVLILAFGFFGVFGGFQAAQGLQTTVNATLGFINLACLYGTFTVLCLVAPPLLASLEAAVGLRAIMVASSLMYAAMALSNIYTENWALPIATNVLVGVAAPLLWTCQNDYVGRCAYQASCSGGAAVDDEQLKTMTASYNSLFFTVYQFTGAAGNILASAVMMAFAGKTWLKDVLFIALSAFSAGGAAVFLLLPKVAAPGRENDENEERATSDAPSLKATAALTFGDKRMTLFIPLIFSNGMLLASFLGDYATDVVCPVAGGSYTGVVLAVFFLMNSFFTACWGKFITKNVVSRLAAFIIAAFFQIAFLLGKLLWSRPQNYEHENGEWVEKQAPHASDFLVIFALVALFAVGDSFWESGVPAALQNYFLGSADLVPAMANYKGWQSFGFAVQFILGAVLSDQPTLRGIILLCLCAVSASSIIALNNFAKMA